MWVLGVWVVFWGVRLRRSLDIIRSMKPFSSNTKCWKISPPPSCWLPRMSCWHSAFGYWRSQDDPLWTYTSWNGAMQAVSNLFLYFYLCLPKHINLSFYIKNCDTKITHVKNSTDRDTGLRRSRWIFNKLVDSPHFLIQLLIHLLISWI